MLRETALFSGLILLLMCLVFPASTHGGERGGVLEGQVKDIRGDGIAGARITLYGRRNGIMVHTTSGLSGQYRFEFLPPGEYLLTAESVGFGPARARSVALEKDSTRQVDLTLEIAAFREEVIVTAAASAQSVDEVSKAVSVVTDAQMLAQDEFSIAEALRSVPGLHVQQSGGPGSLIAIKSRGMRNEDTAVLIDGFRFRDPAAPQGDASGFLSDLLIADTGRVEVLRGSGSSLYGSNAVGGVLHIITDEGGGRSRGRIYMEGGSLGLFRGGIHAAGGTGNDRLNYSLGGVHMNVIRGVDGNDAARNSTLQGRIHYRLSPTISLAGRLYSADSFVQLNNSPEASGPLPPIGIIDAISSPDADLMATALPASGRDANPLPNFIPSLDDPDARQSGRFLSAMVTLSHSWQENFGYTLGYQDLTTRRSYSNGPAGVSFQPSANALSLFDGRIQTASARLHYRFAGHHTIDAGYEFEREQLENQSLPGIEAENSEVLAIQRSHTFYIQEQMKLLGDRLQLSASFRRQKFGLDIPAFSPDQFSPYQAPQSSSPPSAYTGDGSIAYVLPWKTTKLRAHAGNGYRAPSLYERFGTFFGSFGYSVYGDPNLRPGRSIGFDAGLDQTILGGKVRGSITYFYTRVQENIVFDFSGGIQPDRDPYGRFGGYRNARGGLARGLEISAGARIGAAMELEGGYTYTNADLREPMAAGVLTAFGIPQHKYSIVGIRRFGDRIGLNFELVAQSSHLAPLFDPASFETRAFRFGKLITGGVVGIYRWQWSDRRTVRLHGKIENLFKGTYYEGGFKTPGVMVLVGMALEF